MLEATRTLILVEEVTAEVEGLLLAQEYDTQTVLSALHYMHKAIDCIRKLSNKERGVIC